MLSRKEWILPLINIDEVSITKKVKGTPGGTTYYAVLPGKTKSEPLCMRPIHHKPDCRCTNTAGKWTDHVGSGACKKHGGANDQYSVTKIKTGKNASSTKNRLAADIALYLNKDRKDLLDLTREFATLRAVLDEYMDNFPNPMSDNYFAAIDRLQSVVGTLGSLVDKMSKVENRSTLTTAQVLYLRATVVDLFMKYLPDPDMRTRAVKELAARMGGDVTADVEMKPSEVIISGVFTDAED